MNPAKIAIETRARTRFCRTFCWSVVGFVVISSLAGCAGTRYMYGTGDLAQPEPLAMAAENPVQVGGQDAKLDKYEYLFREPLRPVKRALNMKPKEFTPEELDLTREKSVTKVKQYFAANGMHDVNIDVRCYDPQQQWQRLKANPDVSPMWKYSLGTASWLKYKLLPKRVFRQDEYDPFTNTLHVNSEEAEQALYEAAVAKRYHAQGMPGLYAALQGIPFAPVFHHTSVANDVLTYTKRTGDKEALAELYPKAHENVVSSAVDGALSFVPAGTLGLGVEPVIGMAASRVGDLSGKLTNRFTTKPATEAVQDSEQQRAPSRF